MSITRILSDDSYEAAENATGQSATNPFATESVTNSLQSQINALAPGNAVLTGGVSYSGTGFIYDVSALTYRIAGNLYTSALTQVTLNAADPTFDRIDVIYADDNGLVGKITGTPSASPVKPQVDNATQVEVSFVTVGAGATAPSGLTIVDVYLEDAGTPTEWAGTSDFGANFAATADPHSGTKHIDTGAGFTTPNKEMIFTPLAPYTINGGNLNFWLNPQVSLSGPQKGFFVGFYVSGGLVGNSVQIAGVPFITYGFDPLAPLNVYQLVSIPISAFGALPTTIDELRMFKTAGAPSATDMYIDDIQIQEGIPASGGGSIDATAVTYTPTTPGDWSVVPDDVAEALDTLAAAPSGGTVATATELNTGTDNAKFASALALEGSKYLNQSSSKISATAAGTDTYTATIAPAITAYTSTQRFFITFTNANTGAATLNLNGLGAKSLVKNGSVALVKGDIAANEIVMVAYDGTNFQLVGWDASWIPPLLPLGSILSSGATFFLSPSGAGLYLSLDGGAFDDAFVFNLELNNNLPYDGSNLALKIHGATSTLGLGTVGLVVAYKFIANLTDFSTGATTLAQLNTDVTGWTAGQSHTIQLGNMTGLANAHTLMITVTRNSTGAGADSYIGNLRVLELEIVKV